MKTRSPLFFWLGFLSLAAAVGTHIYLMNHHYGFKFGMGGNALCSVSEYLNCDTASASSYSELFGVPIAIFGAVINALLLLAFAMVRWPLIGEKTRSQLPSSLKIISLGILCVSLFMGAISFLVIKSLCPFCLLTYFLSALSVIGIWGYLGKGFSFGAFEIKTIILTGVSTLALGFFFHKVNLRKFGGNQFTELTRLQFQTWQQQKQKDIIAIEPVEMKPKSPVKMTVIEFADFLCSHCKSAFPKIHTFAKAHPDIHFMFQAFPLDGACNPAIGYSEGTRCLLARISHCSGKQDKGFQTQKWIFDNQQELVSSDIVNGRITELAKSVSLNEAALNQCINDEATHKIIKDQAILGKKVGVTGTPSIFVNGKKVPGVSLPVLEMIYKDLTK